MIRPNPTAEQYIQNTEAHIVDGPLIDNGDGGDYGFVYIAATDTIHFAYDAEPTGDLTAEQHYYLQVFTVLGFWAENHMHVADGDKERQRANCRLAAQQICNRFDIIAASFDTSPQAERIVKYLDGLQP